MKQTLTLLLALIISSCSTRKVEKQTEVSIESNTTATTTKADIETNTRIIETATELIIEPVDPQKESTYNGQTFKNARVKHRKTGTAKQTKTTDRSTTNTKSDTKKKVKQKARKSDRTSFNFWWLLLFLIPLFLWLRKRIISPTQRF
jgi:hypothetical protein